MDKLLVEKEAPEVDKKKRAKRILQIDANQLSFDDEIIAEAPASEEVEVAKEVVLESQPYETITKIIEPEYVLNPEIAEPETSVEEEVRTDESTEEDKEVKLLEDERPQQDGKKKNQKFRFKVLAIAYSVVVLIMSSWLIYNAVDLARTEQTLRDVQSELAVQNAQFNNNNTALDDLLRKLGRPTDGESGSVFDDFVDAGIVEIAPMPLQDVSAIPPQSNWFNALVNWLR